MTRPAFKTCTCLALMAVGLMACDASNVRITSARSSSSNTGVLKVVDTLQCPDVQGVLTRKGSADPGGASCTYTGPRGSEVVLHLVKLDGREVGSVLSEFEAQANAEMPNAPIRIHAGEGEGLGDIAQVYAPGVRINASGDDATVKLPGLHVESLGNKTSVRIAGVEIASQRDRKGSTETGQAEGGDEAPATRTASGPQATRITFLLADEDRQGRAWRQVGYEARGPVGGPLVVATVRSKDQQDRVFDDATDLVTLNVGE